MVCNGQSRFGVRRDLRTAHAGFAVSAPRARWRRFMRSIRTGQSSAVLKVELAGQAVDAFVGVDPAVGVDRLDRAGLGADLAGLAALPAALQPFEHADPRRQGERGAERAEVAAVGARDEEGRLSARARA